MASVPPPVFLHIGAMKTGTTFLQGLLSANRQRLAEAGYLYPGRTWGEQVEAAKDLLGFERGRFSRAHDGGPWDAVAAEMLAHRGMASIYSMEFLSFADRRTARRATRSLALADVHVIITVRDASGTVPAQWQTAVRNGNTTPWPAFQRGVQRAARRPRWARHSLTGPARLFSGRQDIGSMIRAWGRGLPPGRVHVVTVPPSGTDPMLLWRRFSQVVQVDPDVCSEPPERANESLGYASAEMMRRTNLHLRDLSVRDYDAVVKEHLGHRVLSHRADNEERAALDPATYVAALRWNATVREAITGAGIDLVGDLDDLPVEASPQGLRRVREDQPEPTAEELLAAAYDAAGGMQAFIRRQRRRLRRRGLTPPEVTAPPVRPTRWGEAPDPTEAAATDLARLCRTAVAQRRLLRAASAHAG